MSTDELFRTAGSPVGDFEFDASVADVFDDMVVRSVPLYAEQQRMVAELARTFWTPGTRIYDLGCSTGTTIANIAGTLDPSATFVGYDNSQPMLDRAAQTLEERGLGERVELRIADLNGDLDEVDLEGASVVTLCWTLQFVRPLRRGALARRIYESLSPNGALIVTEKILTGNSSLNRFFIDFHWDFKRRNLYSEVEIARKREALENVLIPYRLGENRELFRRTGFEIIETFFQWYNFAGFLCLKSSR